MAKKDETMQRSVGRRKTSSARVRITPGKGEIIVNGKALTDYFPMPLSQQKVLDPLRVTSRVDSMDVSVKVAGGGVNSQAEAVRHGIARALVSWNEELRPVLKASRFLTRDPRSKERKKPGQPGARRKFQFVKR